MIPTCVRSLAICGKDRLRELINDLFGDRLAFGLWRIAVQTNSPDTFFETFDGEGVASKKLVLDCKAGVAPSGDTGIDVNNVAEGRRHKEIATGLNEGYAGDVVLPQHFRFLDSQGTMEKRIGAGIKIFEITWEKDDSEGIAIAPLNLDFFAVNEHGQ